MTYIRRNAQTKRSMNKTAGEVRFIKDKSGDSAEWGWGEYQPAERIMDQTHEFNPKCKKTLALVMRSSLIALGHAMTAYSRFTKIKSRDISPDGRLGGKGYIMEIKGMRKQFMNIVEALSSLSDTIYDEINADHWAIARDQIIQKYIEDSEEIMQDPEQWAEEAEEQVDKNDDVEQQYVEKITKERMKLDKEKDKILREKEKLNQQKQKLKEQKKKERENKSKKKDKNAPLERDLYTLRTKVASDVKVANVVNRFMEKYYVEK